MSGKGSLRIISKSLIFEDNASNLGIGGSFTPNVKLTIINNPNSWKNTIFKNNQNSDYVSVGLYDFNSSNNLYIAGIDKSIDVFKDLYINNLGIASQPSSLIGNVIINGKTTIGNSSNSSDFILDVFSKTSNNLFLLRNSNSSLSFFVNSNNFNLNTSTNKIYVNSSLYANNQIIINSNNYNSTDFNFLLNGSGFISNNLTINGLSLLNNNLTVNGLSVLNSNLTVNGIISGNGCNISNIRTSAIILDEKNKIGANLLKISSNSGISSNSSNELIIRYDSNSPIFINNSNELSLNLDLTKFEFINLNQLSIKGNISSGYFQSAIPGATDVADVSRLYFNKNESYVGIKNDDPRSLLYIGANGNFFRLATPADINDSYFSQLATTDNNSNTNKIKLIAPVNQALLTGLTQTEISGSIYYYITGDNPIHSFNYENNGTITPLMTINKQGTVSINTTQTPINNERLIIGGNVSILNSNSTNSARVFIGDSTNNNSLFQTFGSIIVGTSNSEASQFGLYVNSNVKFASGLTISSGLTVSGNSTFNNNLTVSGNSTFNNNLTVNNGNISGNGSGLTDLKISSLYLDDTNNKLKASFIKLNTATGIATNTNNELIINYDSTKFRITSDNKLSLSNSAVPSYWNSAIPLETDPANVSKIYFNKSDSYVGIKNDDPRSYLYVGANGNLLRVATPTITDSYYSQIATEDNINNSNITRIKLIGGYDQQLITSPNNYDISGSIYYYTAGSNPIHCFNYESNGIITPLMTINRQGTVFINNNDRIPANNERLIIGGNVSIFNSNAQNPARVIIGETITNNSLLQTFGSIIIGTSNSEASQFVLYANNHVKFNSNLIVGSNLTVGCNLTIGSNLTVSGIISGIGSNINNIRISALYLENNNSNSKLNANFININSNTGLSTSNNQLIINYDTSKFMMNTSNQLSLTNTAVPSYWTSAIPLVTDPNDVTKVYFNKGDSYVGIKNSDPRSYLYVGANGNLLRVATPTVTDSYYSQIATEDNVNNSNTTRIKLIGSYNQQLITSSNNYDISGSIYYYTSGSNPIHCFNYESNGIIAPLMTINRQGTVFINNNDRIPANNERLIIGGNVSIFNSNAQNPARVVIGETITNNSLLQTFGSIIIGTSNSEASQFVLYANNHVKFNSNLTIGSNLTVGCNLTIGSNLAVGCNLTIGSNLTVSGIISGSGSNINNIRISALYLENNNSNSRLNANFININSNTGLSTSNNQLIINYDTAKFMMNTSNQLSLTNTAVPSYWTSAIPLVTDPNDVTKVYFNKGDSYVGIKNSDPRSFLYVGANGNLLRVATPTVTDSYYSQIATEDTVNNSNTTRIKLIGGYNQQLIVSPNNYDISGSIYYYTSGSNPIHCFNYESNGIITPLMTINRQGTVFINSNNRVPANNERLIVNGNISVFNSNVNNPARVVIGEAITNNSLLQTFGSIIIGTSNSEASQFVLYANNHIKFNSNLIIGSNLTVGCNLTINNNLAVGCNLTIGSNLTVSGIISGSGSNINNIRVSALYLENNDSNSRLNGNFINFNSNTGLSTSNNQLIINYDTAKFMMNTANQLSLTNTAVPSYWTSAIPLVTDPNDVTKVYFNKGDSYVGIKNSDPRSYLYVGANGNLLRVATPTVTDSYYSQIASDDNINNSNTTRIKLIGGYNQQLIISPNNYDISGSIYYYTAGSNPVHCFNYESNGIITPLMTINRQGTVFINSNNRVPANNERLIVNGNISVFNSNINNPARVVIGEATTNNSILQTFGSIVVGSSNLETSQFGLYVNSNVKFTSNLTLTGNFISSSPANFTGNVAIGSLNRDTANILNVSGNVLVNGVITTSSDERLKSNINTYDNALEKILNCRGVSFDFKDNKNNKIKNSIGVIAQEIEKIIPEIVEENDEGFKSVNYLGIIGVLIEAIKDLNKKIDKNA